MSLHLQLLHPSSEKPMIKKAVKSYIKTMYINGHKKRLHWMYYTMLIGALPCLIRLVVWLSVPDIPMLPYAIVGDVVFWAIMLNVAALYNVSTTENIPDVQVSVTAAALMRIAVLVAIYTVALFPGVSPLVLWIAVTLLATLSLFGSYFTTDSTFLESQQQIYDLANSIEGLPTPIRDKVRKHAEQILDGKKVTDIKPEIDKYLAELEAERSQELGVRS